MNTAQEKMFVSLAGLRDQIGKEHYLNVHFRAFELANEAWQEHIRQNALEGSKLVHSPGAAILDNDRSK